MVERRVAVVTESVSSLPRELAASLDIEVIPVPFSYAGRDYLDGENITPGEFYDVLRPDLPPARTSSPSPGAYMEVFKRLCDAGLDVLCITATGKIATRMPESARMGRELAHEEGVEGRIEILDSGSAAMGEGFLALEAARMARRGAGMEEILSRLGELSGRVRLLVTLDTLEYVSKTARLRRLAALFAQALRIKPVILLERGEVRPLETPRTRRKAVGRLLALAEERIRGEGPLHVAVQHAAAREEAEGLAEEVRERLGPEELLIAEFSPVMATYAGPGLLGLAFY